MRILVVSDIHGDFRGLCRAVEAQPDAGLIIFLGDGSRELDAVRELYPGREILSVKGNCDLGSLDLEDAVCMAEGKKILYTHGHKHGVKYSEERVFSFAKAARADILLYGHTHIARTAYREGLYIMNPGSVSQPREGGPSYGVIDITQAGIVLNIISC